MKTYLQLINEVFDKPWNYEWHEEYSNNQRENMKHNPAYSGHHITNVRVSKLEGDNGYLASFIRNGALEVHHSNKDEVSGKLLKSDKPNPRFYGTMMHYYKKYGLDKGKSIRISTEKDNVLTTRYSSIANKLAKQNNLDIKHYDETMGDGRVVHSIELKHKPHFVSEMIKKSIKEVDERNKNGK